MPRLNRDQVKMLALAALVDIAEQAEAAPVAPTLHLRALLSSIWWMTGADETKHWLIDQFWVAVTHWLEGTANEFLDGHARHMNAMTAIRGIQHGLGLPSDVSFDERVKAMVKRSRRRVLKPGEAPDRGV